MFSERRELALSLVSCLLPSSFPPSLLLAPTTPHAASLSEQLGNRQQNTAVMRIPWTRTVARVCPALPALPCVHLGHFFQSWKERLLGLPIQECGRGDGFSPSSPTLAPDTILWGDLAKALGHLHE